MQNDRTDGDGQPLARGERNYLELLGIPPSLSVLRARFLDDAKRSCADVDRDRLRAVDEITTWGATTERKERGLRAARGKRLEEARQKANVADLAGLAASDPKLAREVKAHVRALQEDAAFAEVERRIVCEGLMDPARHEKGRYDTALRAAVLDFQRKHALLAEGDLNKSTLEALAKPPLALDFEALRRVLTERVSHAGGVIEDGSAPATPDGPASYQGADGQRHPVPNLVDDATTRLFEALDLQTPEDTVAFFRRHAATDFQHLRVPIRFPELPEYYASGKPMELSAEIDRGDIWYDFPFDTKGNRLPQPREHYPSFTLYVKWRGERVPMVRWRTTIGGWRSERASDGQEYYAYKGSDVGPRVWRHLVAAPVWLPPSSSPLGSMVKEKRVNGAYVKATNYDETGPGYLSAYGLVAAIHEQMRRGPNGATYSDNGIRTHGSFDYLSLRGRFSHGCHRLYNNQAVRLFSFVLAHHRARTVGALPLGFRRTFWWKGELYDLRLPTRGFYFELEPPIPIETLEGRVRGQQPTPIAGYLPKPGVHYLTPKPPEQTDTPDSKAAGGGEP
ncbi:MAG TPA: murein L,D-transpeptidase [Polyangia bacterium]|nr:murein L,D-transpeptidase [Polyangia bacterium]